MTTEHLKNHFSQFGEVVDVYIPEPFRAIAFVTFADPEVMKGLLDMDHIIDGKQLYVTVAIPRSSPNHPANLKKVSESQLVLDQGSNGNSAGKDLGMVAHSPDAGPRSYEYTVGSGYPIDYSGYTGNYGSYYGDYGSYTGGYHAYPSESVEYGPRGYHGTQGYPWPPPALAAAMQCALTQMGWVSPPEHRGQWSPWNAVSRVVGAYDNRTGTYNLQPKSQSEATLTVGQGTGNLPQECTQPVLNSQERK